jgi:hypothetical protein
MYVLILMLTTMCLQKDILEMLDKSNWGYVYILVLV